MQPHINGPQDISMHIKVEISDVAAEINIAGVQQPEIGQEVDEADIRMKDGEVSILGGLSDSTNAFTAAGIPGITNIPVLGYLFSTKTRTITKQDLMIALIPHIVRPPDLSAASEQPIFAGTEKNPHVIAPPGRWIIDSGWNHRRPQHRSPFPGTRPGTPPADSFSASFCEPRRPPNPASPAPQGSNM